MENANRPKDPCIYFRNVVKGKSTKKDSLNPEGHDRVQLYLTQQDAANLRDAIDAIIEDPNGVKLDLHITKRVNKERGNVFESAYTFVKTVDPAPQKGQARFVPKGTPSEETYSRTEKVARELE